MKFNEVDIINTLAFYIQDKRNVSFSTTKITNIIEDWELDSNTKREIVHTYSDVINLFLGKKMPLYYDIDESKKIISKNKDLIIKLVKFFEEYGAPNGDGFFFIMPIYSYLTNLFTKKIYVDNYEDGIDFYLSTKDKNSYEELVNQIVKYRMFYVFPFYKKEDQEKFKNQYSKEYTIAKFHIENNPIMKYVKECVSNYERELKESITHSQANYLLS